jgi:pimeloyl-ACP methyl ester carboxylesterase
MIHTKGGAAMREPHAEYPEFRWLERGEGEPVVLLHGLMGRMEHWEETLESLGNMCRAIALSLPILEHDVPEASIEGVGRYVARFLDALDIPKAVVGGNSLGGHVALELALAYQERVSGLVLTGSSGLLERGFTRGVPHRPSGEYVREKMEEIFFDARLVTPEWVESVRRTVTTPASALRVLRFARAAKRHNIEGRLGHIPVPTLLVWGRDDRITPPEIAERFHALLPDSRLRFLPRCGHAAMLEQPDAFNELVAEWLVETRGRRAPALVGGLR